MDEAAVIKFINFLHDKGDYNWTEEMVRSYYRNSTLEEAMSRYEKADANVEKMIEEAL